RGSAAGGARIARPGIARRRAGRLAGALLPVLVGALSLGAAGVAAAEETATLGSAALLSDLVRPKSGDLFDGSRRVWDPAPLWSHLDPVLEADLADALHDLGLGWALAQQKLAVALVDITDLRTPRVAALNGDTMMYAASLPKICVLLAAYQKEAEGRFVIDDETYLQILRMIRLSDNGDSTALMHKIGKDYI